MSDSFNLTRDPDGPSYQELELDLSCMVLPSIRQILLA